MTRVFYRNANCVFLCYDVTREETFEGLPIWLNEIKQNASEDVRIFLIGNKCELNDKRVIDFERGLKFAKENNIHMCFETSAKTGDHVEEVFSIAAKSLYQQEKEEDTKKEEPTPENPKEEEEKKEEEERQARKRLGGGKKKKKNNNCCK